MFHPSEAFTGPFGNPLEHFISVMGFIKSKSARESLSQPPQLPLQEKPWTELPWGLCWRRAVCPGTCHGPLGARDPGSSYRLWWPVMGD